jgi:hypothetical protein
VQVAHQAFQKNESDAALLSWLPEAFARNWRAEVVSRIGQNEL